MIVELIKIKTLFSTPVGWLQFGAKTIPCGIIPPSSPFKEPIYVIKYIENYKVRDGLYLTFVLNITNSQKHPTYYMRTLINIVIILDYIQYFSQNCAYFDIRFLSFIFHKHVYFVIYAKGTPFRICFVQCISNSHNFQQNSDEKITLN